MADAAAGAGAGQMSDADATHRAIAGKDQSALSTCAVKTTYVMTVFQ